MTFAAVPNAKKDEFVTLVKDRIAHQIRTGAEWNQQFADTIHLAWRPAAGEIEQRLRRIDKSTRRTR